MVSYQKGCESIKTNYKARKILANNIVYYRLLKGWSQEYFAEKLGTTTTYLSSLENAKRNTSIDYIEHLSNTLDIGLSQLLEDRGPILNHRIPRKTKNMQIFFFQCLIIIAYIMKVSKEY